MEHSFIEDPYRRCEDHCNHDLVRGVLVADLIAADGPHRPNSRIITLPLDRRFERGTFDPFRQAG